MTLSSTGPFDVFVDESGHSGFRIIDSVQPFLVLGALMVPSAVRQAVMRMICREAEAHFNCSPRSLKGNKLVKSDATRKNLIRWLREVKRLGGELIAVGLDKRFVPCMLLCSHELDGRENWLVRGTSMDFNVELTMTYRANRTAQEGLSQILYDSLSDEELDAIHSGYLDRDPTGLRALLDVQRTGPVTGVGLRLRLSTVLKELRIPPVEEALILKRAKMVEPRIRTIGGLLACGNPAGHLLIDPYELSNQAHLAGIMVTMCSAIRGLAHPEWDKGKVWLDEQRELVPHMTGMVYVQHGYQLAKQLSGGAFSADWLETLPQVRLPEHSNEMAIADWVASLFRWALLASSGDCDAAEAEDIASILGILRSTAGPTYELVAPTSISNSVSRFD